MPRQPSRRRLRRKSVHCSLFRGCVILNQGFFALCGILVSLSVSLPRALWALRADRRLFQVRLGKARIYLLAAAVFTVNALPEPYYGGISSASVLARRAGNGVCCGIRAPVVF
jgi:hypothetical protein